NMIFIPPFDDCRIIEGQGTVGVEILEDFFSPLSGESEGAIDYLFIPVGGGGLASGVGNYFKTFSPQTKIIGLEPEGAPAMYASFKAGYP
ncbi:pyridoxal-phosphate dependent enzyme, partial [Klebsiella pneumoniae]|uniref:pyridoxal-phosphate dependent enzyme n=1 Tax=Klebsiella pneumoniae TaxID=573 RepID=UPI003853CCBB